jgi:hypothetical protein
MASPLSRLLAQRAKLSIATSGSRLEAIGEAGYLPVSSKLHSPGHRSADRISHGAVTIGPFQDATQICTRVGFNSDPRSRGQRTGRNGVVHAQDAVIV